MEDLLRAALHPFLVELHAIGICLESQLDLVDRNTRTVVERVRDGLLIHSSSREEC